MASTRRKQPPRTLDARPDTIDFRDLMFVPSLIEVPVERTLQAFIRSTGGRPVILHQGQEGACAGFGLAAVCNHLLRSRAVTPDRTPVSPRMLYEMARRYDEWPGQDYDGSSSRGAMKGWHKHGVCGQALWRQDSRPDGRKKTTAPAAAPLTPERLQDAVSRPLGAYFRVNHKDLVAMHAALAEVGILFAAADVHAGWQNPGAKGRIAYGAKSLGGHAFAIVGYDLDGFWIQNSWGTEWGNKGFAHLSYSDWLDHGYDVWVARLGARVRIDEARVSGGKSGGLGTARLSFPDLRPHVISLDDNGLLRSAGTYANSASDIDHIFKTDFPRVTASWKRKRILLFAHGGLVPEANALQRVENYVEALRAAEIYPLMVLWRSGFWSSVGQLLEAALGSRRKEDSLDAGKDFMLDRLDDTLERLVRPSGGKRAWDEMRDGALQATAHEHGGARILAAHLAQTLKQTKGAELHVAGHSAGGILLGPLVQLLGELGAKISSCTLWAPACDMGLFKTTYAPALAKRTLRKLALFTLKEAAEQDDHCSKQYNKSLLYLISNALERKPRAAGSADGWPLLGMEKFVQQDRELQRLIAEGTVEHIVTPNDFKPGSPQASGARGHGDFDDDKPTVQALLARILGQDMGKAEFRFSRSAVSARERRRSLG